MINRTSRATPGTDTPHQTRDTVRIQAFRLFGRHGYDGVSIDNIARAVGLSKGALYWHFDGKEALFLECLQGLDELFQEHIVGPMGDTATPTERLDRFFRGVVSLAEDPRTADGIAGYWQEPAREDMSRSFREKLGKLEGQIRDLLRSALEHMEKDARTSAVGIRSETLMTLMEALLLPLRHRTPETRRAIMDDLRETVLAGYAKS